MPKHDIFVIGGSAGALQPLVAIVEALPATLEASLLVTMHTASGGATALPQILGRASKLPRNIVTAIPPRRPSVVAAFLLFGFLNAGTPLLMASTPVSAVQPEANDRSNKKSSAKPV